MSELAVGALADRPRLKNITHQRQTLSLVQIEISRRTVRAPGADRPPFNLENQQRPKRLWCKLSISRRTVRAPGADRPPLRTTTQLEKHPLWYKVELKGWTIHAPWAGPPFILQPTPETTSSLVHYSKGTADRPRPMGGLSALSQ